MSGAPGARILELKPPLLGHDEETRLLLGRLLKGLKAAFPYSTFRIDVEREKCVFGRGGDGETRDQMRKFCAGFVAAL